MPLLLDVLWLTSWASRLSAKTLHLQIIMVSALKVDSYVSLRYRNQDGSPVARDAVTVVRNLTCPNQFSTVSSA